MLLSIVVVIVIIIIVTVVVVGALRRSDEIKILTLIHNFDVSG